MMLPRVIHSKYVLVFLAMGSGTKGNFYFVTYLCIFLQQKYGWQQKKPKEFATEYEVQEKTLMKDFTSDQGRIANPSIKCQSLGGGEVLPMTSG